MWCVTLTMGISLTMRTIFGTENAALRIGAFDQPKLLVLCTEQVLPLLHKNPPIQMWGRACTQPRNVGFFCDSPWVAGYTYSRQIMPSQPLPEPLQEMLQIVNDMLDSNFNAILVNCYETGENTVSSHSDDSRHLDTNHGVVSISYGATRKFRVRDIHTNRILIDVMAESGSILQMTGDFQSTYKHEIPLEKRIKDSRVSFTFRHHRPDL